MLRQSARRPTNSTALSEGLREDVEAGDTEAGCSVHLVDRTLDGGDILGQARVPVLPHDTPESLAARVLLEEHTLYPRVLRAALEGRLETQP